MHRCDVREAYSVAPVHVVDILVGTCDAATYAELQKSWVVNTCT